MSISRMDAELAKRNVTPLIAGLCLLVAGVGTGHALMGVACGLAVAAGLELRRRPGRRAWGNALFLAGALAFAVGILFGTGYRVGRHLAERDATHGAASSDATTATPSR